MQNELYASHLLLLFKIETGGFTVDSLILNVIIVNYCAIFPNHDVYY